MNLTITPKVTSNYNIQNHKSNNSQQNFGELSVVLKKHIKETTEVARNAKLKRDKTIDAMMGFFNKLLKDNGMSTRDLEEQGYKLTFFPRFEGGSPMRCCLLGEKNQPLITSKGVLRVEVRRGTEEAASQDLVEQLSKNRLLTQV